MTRVWANFVRRDTPAVTIPGVGTMAARTEFVLQGAATCDNCSHVSVGFRTLRTGETAQYADNKFDVSPVLTWHPLKVHAPEVPDVPEHIAAAAIEAHTASAVGAPMAAILMARTVVEATAKSQGITTGSLFQKIDALASQDFIRPSTKDAAHEIRHFGNDMAHGDIDGLTTDEDASAVLALMDEVLNEVFQGPARTARIRARRETPAAAESSPTQPEAGDDDHGGPQAGIPTRAR